MKKVSTLLEQLSPILDAYLYEGFSRFTFEQSTDISLFVSKNNLDLTADEDTYTVLEFICNRFFSKYYSLIEYLEQIFFS